MNALDKLTTDIRVHLDRQEATGWYSINCPVCKETRTRTGGFLFTPDGIHYNCFRGKCDASCALTAGEPVSRKFKSLMQIMGVQIPVDLLMVKRRSTFQQLIHDESHLYEKHSYKHVERVDGFIPIEEASKAIQVEVMSYFASRHIEPQNVVYAVSGQYKGLYGVEMYLSGKRIGMQVVTKKGYVSLYGGNSHILFAPAGRINSPVILVEGGMDAMCFPNAVACLGNRITPQQAYALKGHEVIMLPDRSGGNEFVNQFSDYGWKLCIPDWKEKDLNEAVCRYGKIVVAKKIVDGIMDNKLEAELKYNLWRMS